MDEHSTDADVPGAAAPPRPHLLDLNTCTRYLNTMRRNRTQAASSAASSNSDTRFELGPLTLVVQVLYWITLASRLRCSCLYLLSKPNAELLTAIQTCIFVRNLFPSASPDILSEIERLACTIFANLLAAIEYQPESPHVVGKSGLPLVTGVKSIERGLIVALQSTLLQFLREQPPDLLKGDAVRQAFRGLCYSPFLSILLATWGKPDKALFDRARARDPKHVDPLVTLYIEAMVADIKQLLLQAKPSGASAASAPATPASVAASSSAAPSSSSVPPASVPASGAASTLPVASSTSSVPTASHLDVMQTEGGSLQ